MYREQTSSAKNRSELEHLFHTLRSGDQVIVYKL
ncbi:hypothetical protein OZL92_02400 [Bacillus sonorensis]|nr:MULTISPECIES: hypothetical protein [Bacillus]MCZ0071622.1 hypothetical protein [Bacillus sonorensis]MCZ0090243.1 hypothetical protein [Bacillus sonorensis]MDI3411359.1 hypothetical protein [Bacillus sonorensis]MDR4959107.1 hypothetical protein [Bacillus sonorensis]MEC0339344.1 hypothetical protein [Bacillus sonorensis]